MTPEQRDALAARIEDEIARLGDVVRTAREQAKPVSLDDPIGRLSRMDALANQQMDEARLRMAERRITALDNARRRLEDDDYGDCQACGEEIAFGRLNARPEVTLCTACQREREG